MDPRTRARRRRAAGPLLIILACLGTALTLRAGAPPPMPGDAATIRHVLNRVTFGPRPGDVERVGRLGLAAYLEHQLHPHRIPDPELDRRLSGFRTLGMTSGEIARSFAQPLFEARRRRPRDTAEPGGRPESDRQTRRRDDGSGQPQVDAAVVRAAALPVEELAEQKVLRAIYSERQLEAVLTDFWFNHFNVDARKALDRFFITEYERETIRPHVLGRFRDLLGATAASPAMLFYLDNWLSADPAGPHDDAPGAGGSTRREARRQRLAARRLTAEQRARLADAAPKKNGLNENYARELLELHTLGVDGGYTQTDVTEVARAFTGWTLDRPRAGGGSFRFDPRLHDPGDKRMLGVTIRGGARDGRQDGETVLDLLARHPSTARFLSTKLARRFVSDDPPAALVDRMAARFRATDGDLREVMRTLLTAPEFLAPPSFAAKTKTPFEFVVSAIRALGADVVAPGAIVRQVASLGMPLYQCQPPTGYKDTADAWTSAGALIARMNVAQVLAQGTPRSGLSGPSLLTPEVTGPRSPSTEAVVARASSDWQRTALALGAPEFQKR